MTRRKTTATAKRNKTKPKGRKPIAILDKIRQNMGKKPEMYGDEPPKPTLQKIRIDDLHVDNTYQRPMKPSLVKRIAVEFDYKKFGVPVVVLRNGKFYVIDAQQRIAGAKLRNLACPGFLTSVWCEVVPDVAGRTEEAKLFGGRNDNQKVNTLERFKSDYAAGKNSAVKIVGILNGRGLAVKGMHRPNTLPITCVAPVRWAYDTGVLEDTIDAIKATWGLIEEAFQVTCFHPIAAALHKNKGRVDIGHMADVLKKYTPSALKTKCGTTDGRSRTANIANFIVKAYNKGMKTAQQIDEVEVRDIK